MEFEAGKKYDIIFTGGKIALTHMETRHMGLINAYYFGEDSELILYSTDNGSTFFRPHGTRKLFATIMPHNQPDQMPNKVYRVKQSN